MRNLLLLVFILVSHLGIAQIGTIKTEQYQADFDNINFFNFTFNTNYDIGSSRNMCQSRLYLLYK